MRGLIALGILALSTFGCAGDDDDDNDTVLAGEPLDCAWFTGDNCWKTLVQSAASCAPPEAETGTLSEDGKSCTYAGGYDVTFDEPLTLPLDDFPPWNFVQKKDGAPCVTYDENPDSSLYLDVRGMQFKQVAVGFGAQFTCPDGSQFAAQNAFDVFFECMTLFSEGPGSVASWSGSSVNFALLRGMPGPLSVFDCSR
jgi:hypothetical protein